MIFRYFNAAGADPAADLGEHHTPETHLIPLLLDAMSGRLPYLQVFGDDYDTPDGTCIRDYIHVADLADAHVKALRYLGDGGETIAVNVGTGVGSSVFDVLAATEAVAGEPVPYDIAPRRAGDPVSTYADPSFAKATLGWEARYGLEEIVDSAYAWHRSQLEAGR